MTCKMWMVVLIYLGKCVIASVENVSVKLQLCERVLKFTTH